MNEKLEQLRSLINELEAEPTGFVEGPAGARLTINDDKSISIITGDGDGMKFDCVDALADKLVSQSFEIMRLRNGDEAAVKNAHAAGMREAYSSIVAFAQSSMQPEQDEEPEPQLVFENLEPEPEQEYDPYV